MYVLALEILKQQAYSKYASIEQTGTRNDMVFEDEDHVVTINADGVQATHVSPGPDSNAGMLDYEEWLEKLCKEQPQADYYNKCQELDLLILEVCLCCH